MFSKLLKYIFLKEQLQFLRWDGMPPQIQSGTDLYIHYPFCKNICPYCPYYKEPYNPDVSDRYWQALIKEIEIYKNRYALHFCNTESLYIGGGTPTIEYERWAEIFSLLRSKLAFKGSIAVETHPDDLCPDMLNKLRSLGVDKISVGVQSFHDGFLKQIGRKYNREDLSSKLNGIKQHGFNLVNFDMIFVFENQSLNDFKNDLDNALLYSPDQITCYPLFTFPYAPIAEFNKRSRVKLPDFFMRRKLYYFLCEYMKKRGYTRTSVWSFTKGGIAPFSSVTRDRFVGLGPGAATYTGSEYLFNVFSVDEYVKKIRNGDFAFSLKMNVSSDLNSLFMLYWKVYETYWREKDLETAFASRKGLGFCFYVLKKSGFIKKEDSMMVLTDQGAHWIHLIQNTFALNYIAKIWQACRLNPYPEKIVL